MEDLGKQIRSVMSMERKSGRCRGKEEDGLTGGSTLSTTQGERPTRQRVSWASGRIRPKAGNGARAEIMGRGERRSNAGRGEGVGLLGQKRGEEVNSFFFFLFKYFKAFSNDFES
jgi:hypothetical protein